ncbi:hypothetical protein L486_02304 [Kwoniella mangroviensis CBS 10435]|uniref:ARID domain-containing protein n=1 Tax=Kwoniella mangroviensis CBS 10435 TaxID=1331196 RepID=A0A1B9IVS2_9TREE|nr:hypothetical protein L486_02304 [Kwoniella mangroviensis CBS 10435]
MSNPYQQSNGYNPAQLNPALFASLTSQNQQVQNPNPIQNPMQPQQGNINMNPAQAQQKSANDLNGALQNIMLPMFNRLQGQNVARMEQQRLGINPQQQQQQQQPNQQQQQQFQGMAQQMNMAGLPGMNMNMNTNMMNHQQPQQPQQPQQQQMYGQQPQQGYSIHSQQQGLALQPNPSQQQQPQQQPQQQQQQQPQQQMQNLPGMNMGMLGDSEQGRRLMLSNMLSQATNGTHPPVPNQQQPPQQQQMQMRPPPQQQQQQLQQQAQPQPQASQQAMQLQQAANLNNINPQIAELFRNRPDLAQAVMKKHGGNAQRAMEDMQRTVDMMTNAQQQRAREAQAQLQQQQQQVQQQQQQQPSQQQPISVGINGQMGIGMGFPGQMPNQQSQQPQQQQQRPPSQQMQQQQPQPPQQQVPQQQQPRVVSDNGQFNMAQGQQGNQYANTLSQLEALQQMKERQQRSGLKTPQMQQPGLPMASPQQPVPNLNASAPQAGLGVNLNQPYQMLQQNLPQPQVQQGQRQTPQMAQQQLVSQSQRPQPQPHQSQTAPTQSTPQMQTPNLASGSMAPPPANTSSGPSRTQYFEQIPLWPNDKLTNATSLIAKKLFESLQSGSSGANEQMSRYHLLLLVAEIKKRGLIIPQDALTVATAFMQAPNATQALMAMDPNALRQIAQGNIDRIMGAQDQTRNQMQAQNQQQQGQQAQQAQMPTQPQHARQRSYQGQPPQQGSQNNPIELITPTMNQMALPQQFSTPVQPNAAPQQQQAQQQQQFAPQQQPQWIPNTAQQAQSQSQAPAAPAPAPPLMGLESMNLPEENFWHTLKQIHPTVNVQNPIVEGRALNLYKLFQIVLKNGGSAKIDPSRWTIVAGQSGLAPEPLQANGPQPLISTPNAAQQARACYAQVLQPLENLFMARIQQSRQNVGQAQQQVQTQQQPLQQVQSQQQFQQPSAQQNPQQQVRPSPQIQQGHVSNSQSQVPQLSEQQKRFLEAAKNAGPGTGTLEGLAQQVTQQGQPAPTQQTPNVSAPDTAPQQAQSQSQGQSGNVKGNPLKIYEFIKTQETQVRAKLEKNPSIPSVDKEAYRNELAQLLPIIREAEQRVPMFLLMMKEMGAPEMSAGPQIVSMYTSALYASTAAESDRYILNVSDLHRIRLGLGQLMARAQSMFRALTDKPGGNMLLKEMNTALNKAKLQFIAQNQAQAQIQSQAQSQAQSQSHSQPPPQPQAPLTGNQNLAQQPVGSSPANIVEAIAARHKSLRVEDLKPPPAKRAKGAKGSPATPSGTGQTPEAKTPAMSNVDSPGSVKKSGGKRKRQSSNAVNSATALQNVVLSNLKTPKDLMAEVKESMSKISKPSLASDAANTAAGTSATLNALGIDLTPNEVINQVELDQNKTFFDNQTQLNLAAGILPYQSSSSSSTTIMSNQEENNLIAGLPLDTWQIFTQAYEAFQASQSQANQVQSQVQSGNGSQSGMVPPTTINNSMLGVGVNGNGIGIVTRGGGKDDLFEQFIDVTQLTEELPTPELFRTNSNLLDGEGGGGGGEESDNSPESIKTVASTNVPLIPIYTSSGSTSNHNIEQPNGNDDKLNHNNNVNNNGVANFALGSDNIVNVGDDYLGGNVGMDLGTGLMMGSDESGMYNGGIWWGNVNVGGGGNEAY